ncbi:MAG: hypothetical protein LBO78_02575, partial [Rickettsiales bacterium]|nr:hypothetical protein [Rickettsiales bacterium]
MANDFKKLPKIELHYHLRGAIPTAAARQLSRRYCPHVTDAEFEAFFDIGDFKSFWRAYDFVTGLVRDEEDFAFAAGFAAEQLRQENVIYSEVSLTPFAFAGIQPCRVLEITREAFQQAGVRMSFIAPFERHDPPNVAADKYAFYKEAREFGIRGIGLAGDECANPTPAFAKIFDRAKADGFGITVHAGEYRDCSNVAFAVRRLCADRIGHGNNISDPTLTDEIIEKGVHIEMCPLSNMRLNRQITPENYDLPRYIRNGMSISVNSDDPGI